jgi:hypothetical protein
VPVKAKIGTLSKAEIDGITTGLRFVTSPQFAAKSLNFDKLKADLLAYLQDIFPVASNDARKSRARTPHLVTGFRFYDMFSGMKKTGFVLQHRGIKQEYIRRILASLETGHRGFYIFPKAPFTAKDGRQVGVFRFLPGDGRGDRHSTGGAAGDFATVSRLHIPATKGGKYMQKVMTRARQLLSDAKPAYFKAVREEMKKRTKRK